MKQLKRLLWLAGLLVGTGTGNLAAAQNDHEQISESEPSSALKVKASIEARGAYDFRNYYAAPDFGPATIPMKGDINNKKRFLFDIPSASLSIEKELPLAGEEALKLVVQANLKKELALKSVYADFKGFRIGKSTTNFCDPDACGLVGGRFVQARWQHKWQHKLNTLFGFAVAIEDTPDLVIYPKEKDQAKKPLKPNKNIPAVSARVRYEQEKLWHVQLGVLLRVLEYRNTRDGMDIYMPTWGGTVSTALHLVPEKTTLRLQGVYGQGIGSYMADIGDLEKEANTVYPTDANDEKSARETLDAWGVAMGVEHKWLPKLRSKASYRFVPVIDNKRGEDAYQYGHAASVNLFYHPTEQIKIGAEYLLSVRKNITGDPKDAHRIQAVVGFDL
jgi:hypothetical protein